MENKKDKVALNDELLDKAVGGNDDDESWKIREWTSPPFYPTWHAYCGQECYYDTPYPETCKACGMPIILRKR